MFSLIFLALLVASLVTIVVFILNVWDGLPPLRAVHRAAASGATASAFFMGGFAAGNVIGWALERAGVGMRLLDLSHYVTATAIGLAVAGVFLACGRTRWRSALCGAGTVASFLTVLAIAHGAGV
ncbi:MAG TPA: hypothetical protein VIQ29_04395 [Ancylobacter sp.]